ncbi:hypothetical protein E4U14_005086 [Claviceps sp. LM454 group G7]|nr:hypothetical protein E4U14_005086 [Claviceps sp. LM454 group G7]
MATTDGSGLPQSEVPLCSSAPASLQSQKIRSLHSPGADSYASLPEVGEDFHWRESLWELRSRERKILRPVAPEGRGSEESASCRKQREDPVVAYNAGSSVDDCRKVPNRV